ncbi:hypothetical protein T07_1326 [Trichinella nelsoni]|uniref:Uncharacterized protein n=1 Tax=Trichinella nelsoni TaxID=6336 RepID=A0A0V0S653_9BILA|nr:hypothetical protein T07_1326 [Trichinella nelsoni]
MNWMMIWSHSDLADSSWDNWGLRLGEAVVRRPPFSIGNCTLVMEQMAFKFGILSVSIHSPASRAFRNTLRNGQLRTAGTKFGQTLSSSFGISREQCKWEPPGLVCCCFIIIPDRLMSIKSLFRFQGFSRKLQISWAIDSVVFAKIEETPFVKIWNIHNDH